MTQIVDDPFLLLNIYLTEFDSVYADIDLFCTLKLQSASSVNFEHCLLTV